MQLYKAWNSPLHVFIDNQIKESLSFETESEADWKHYFH